jgi:hypothetical protein
MTLEILIKQQSLADKKLSTLLPYMQIIARQNKLNLRKLSEFKKCFRLLQISIAHN